MTTNYLLFLLAERVFGVKLSGAKEIFPWRRPRPVPLAYTYIEGLIDYRGTVYPVYSLDQRLGLKRPGPIGFTAPEEAEPAPMKGKSIILLEEKNVPFGIIVDTVLKMAALEEPEDAPKKIDGVDTKYIRGLVKTEDHDVILVDFERLLHAG
jgi:purine-binding chemotaxis protein CheW